MVSDISPPFSQVAGLLNKTTFFTNTCLSSTDLSSGKQSNLGSVAASSSYTYVCVYVCTHIHIYISIMSRRVPSGLMEDRWGCVEGIGDAHNVLAFILFDLF